MNRIDTGDYKLAFLLPVFPETKNILFLDLEFEGLRRKLVDLGVDVRTGSIGDPGPERGGGGGVYDLIVSGRMPSGREEESAFIKAVGDLLSPSGHLVAMAINKFGQSRFRGRTARSSPPGEIKASPVGIVGTCTLRGMLRIIRRMGFKEVRSYSPIPCFENPSMFISLDDANSMKFLLAQFPDFFVTRSRLLPGLLDITLKTGTFKYFLDQYVIVAGKRQNS